MPTKPPATLPDPDKFVSKAEVVEIVAEEVDRLTSDPKSKLSQHLDARGQALMKIMNEATQGIIDSAVDAALKVHVEMAFPPGPIHGHKAHHQGLIDSAEQWKKIKHDILSWGAKGCIGFVVYVVGTAVVEYLKREVTK
jgi:hypothetical protein